LNVRIIISDYNTHNIFYKYNNNNIFNKFWTNDYARGYEGCNS
jgi:hypothetical protein